MSRSGYTDDCENFAMWRGMVASATRGKRGQRFLRELLDALDTMPEKRLISGELQQDDGEVCAIGALGVKRGIPVKDLDPDDPLAVADIFDIAPCLAQEVVFMNDEYYDQRLTDDKKAYRDYTPEERWQKMRDWIEKQIKP